MFHSSCLYNKLLKSCLHNFCTSWPPIFSWNYLFHNSSQWNVVYSLHLSNLLYRHTSSYSTSQILCFFFFYKLKVCGNPATIKSMGTMIPTAFAHLVSVTSSEFSQYFKLFQYFICYGDDQWSLIYYCNCFVVSQTMLLQIKLNWRILCVFSLVHQVLSPSSWTTLLPEIQQYRN